jgi:hypothetical protein
LPKNETYNQVESVFSDPTKPDAFEFAKDRQWDVVFDTWATEPQVVQRSARALRNHAPYYSYVSSCSVYNEDPLPNDINENSPIVGGDSSAERTNYATWMVACAEQKTSGAFNSISPINHATMSDLLDACRVTTKSDAHFTWVPPDFLQENEVQPWTEMPIWLSPNLYGMFTINTNKAAESGLVCRPLIETVVDTWTAMQNEEQPQLNE